MKISFYKESALLTSPRLSNWTAFKQDRTRLKRSDAIAKRVAHFPSFSFLMFGGDVCFGHATHSPQEKFILFR
jgi:hypothetical protein